MARRGFKIADGYLEITADRSQADREMRGLWRDQNGYLRDAKGNFAMGIGAAVAAGLANTAIQVGSHFLVQFAVASAHAGGALALLAPAGILTLVTTLLTLKLAFSGLGDALKAGWQG